MIERTNNIKQRCSLMFTLFQLNTKIVAFAVAHPKSNSYRFNQERITFDVFIFVGIIYAGYFPFPSFSLSSGVSNKACFVRSLQPQIYRKQMFRFQGKESETH